MPVIFLEPIIISLLEQLSLMVLDAACLEGFVVSGSLFIPSVDSIWFSGRV